MARISRAKRGSLSPVGRSASEKSSAIISLPLQVSEVESDIGKYTYLYCGDRKIGKTSMCACFPDPFFIMCEPGGKGLAIRKVDVKTWEDIKKVVYLLESDPEYCTTIVIDTGYMFYNLCFDYCLRVMGLDDPRDEGWGNGWKYIEREFLSEHMKILNAGYGLVVTAHAEVKEVKRQNGVKYDKLTTQLGGQAARFYNGFMDMVCYYIYDEEGKRILTIRADGWADAGTRASGHFLYTNGQPIVTIPMDFSGKKDPERLAFQRFTQAFNNELNDVLPQGGRRLRSK